MEAVTTSQGEEEEDGEEDDESTMDGAASLIVPIVGAAGGVLGVMALFIFGVYFERRYSWLERLDLRFWAMGKHQSSMGKPQSLVLSSRDLSRVVQV
jgi:hypothetical protein